MSALEQKTTALLDRYGKDAGFSRTNCSDKASPTRLVLAPMAGVTGPAYRLLNVLGGVEATFSEMISVAGLMHASKKSKRLMSPHPFEKHFYVQLFGSDPIQFMRAVPILLKASGTKLAGVDINMACPVKKVVSKGEGSALLEDPCRACALVQALRETLPKNITVSVKTRLGKDPEHPASPDFFKKLYQAGASEIAIHGRYASEFYHGSARIDEVVSLAHSLPGPVSLTGDMLDAATVAYYRDLGLFSKILLARGTYGNPWLAQDVRLSRTSPHPLSEKLTAFELLIRFMELFDLEMGRIRLYASHFLRGFPEAPRYRDKAMQCKVPADYYLLIEAIRKRYV